MDDELTLHVPLIASALWSGDHLMFPVAAPTLAAFGAEAETIEEQRLFLRDYLSRIQATELSKFTMPAETRLERFEIVIPREDLPRRLQVETPIAFSVLVIPSIKDAWVVIPKIDHTFYVGKGESIEEAVRSEIKRLAAARELTPAAYLSLFPPREEQLTHLDVPVERMERAPEGRIANLEKTIIERRKKKLAVDVLNSIGQPVHDRLDAKYGPALLGRDSQLATLNALLTAKQRASVLLIGSELVGKSALLLAWLRENRRKDRFQPIYATSGAQLIAGMSGLGQWQERVKRVMESAELLDAILYFDNLADLFGDRATSTVDIAGAMKQYLDENRVRVVGELTAEALDLFESRHVGFFSTFARVRLEPLDAKTTEAALRDRINFDREKDRDRPTLAPEAVTPLMDLVQRYHPYRPFPGKAMRFYEEVRTVCERDRNKDGKVEPISAERVLEAFSMQSGIPQFLLREDRALEKDAVIDSFKKRLIGQERAIERVVDTICVVKAQLQPAGKPLATFLFVGPTGVGKTELARTLAAFLFGSAERMVRFDMSEYVDPFAAERLIRGTDRSEGLLTRRVRQQPFSVLLLDEIEKAHPAVFDLLLQVAGEGRLTDAQGRTAYFHNTIIIMTSNLGAAHRKSAVGVDPDTRTREEHFIREVNLTFRPEFVNRLDRIIAFAELTEEEVAKVARIAIEKIRMRRGLLDGGISLDVSEAALAHLARIGYSEAYGARALRRTLEDELVAPVSRLIGRSGADARGGTVSIALAGEQPPAFDGFGQSIGTSARGSLVFDIRRPKTERVRRGTNDINEAFHLRRLADRHLSLDRVQQVKEQLGFLLSQLAYGGEPAKNKDKRSSHDIAELQSEHHRLSRVFERIERAHTDLLVAEEVALIALFENEETGDFVREVESAFAVFQRGLVYALVALEPLRDEITLKLTELDEGRGLDLWLQPLLEDIERREWYAEVHFEGEKGTPAEKWPIERRYGPPRDKKTALEKLTDKTNKKPRSVVLRVRGPYAGVLLALEAGMLRFIKTHPHVNPVHLSIVTVAVRFKLSDREWLQSVFDPPSPVEATLDYTRIRANREWDGTHKKLLIGETKLAIPLAEYFRRFEEIAVVHLLGYEDDSDKDRTQLFVDRLTYQKEDEIDGD